MKLTPEQDARICAEYGVTPGEWTRYDAAVLADGATISHCPNGPHNRHQEPNAALMAASKEMLALLEQFLANDRSFWLLPDDPNLPPPEKNKITCDRVRALLDGLKGGSNEQD